MIKKIKVFNGLIKTTDGQVLAGNFAYLLMLQVANYVFPLITIPYLARVIGVEGFGKIAFAAAIILWLQTIADWGFNYTATRDVAKSRDDPERISEIFSNVLWARLFLMAVSFALLVMAISFVPYLTENKLILYLSFLLVPGHIMFPDWFFQAMERMKFITIFSVISRLVFTVLVFIFIKDDGDYILHPVLVSLGYWCCGVFSLYIILVRWKVKLRGPRFKEVFRTIRGSGNVFLNNIMPNLYNSFSVVLLGFYGGAGSNGLLDAGKKFVDLGQQFLMVVSRVFFPFLSRRIDKHHVYLAAQLGASLLLSLIIVGGAPLIIGVFFTEEFGPAIPVLQIMAVSLVFLALSNIYGTNYLIIRGHDKALRNVTFLISIVGFCMAFPLIYYFDYLGAAITIAATRGLLGIAITLTALRIKKLDLVT